MTTKKLKKLHCLLEECNAELSEHFEGFGDQALRTVDSTVCKIIVNRMMESGEFRKN